MLRSTVRAGVVGRAVQLCYCLVVVCRVWVGEWMGVSVVMGEDLVVWFEVWGW